MVKNMLKNLGKSYLSGILVSPDRLTGEIGFGQVHVVVVMVQYGLHGTETQAYII